MWACLYVCVCLVNTCAPVTLKNLSHALCLSLSLNSHAFLDGDQIFHDHTSMATLTELPQQRDYFMRGSRTHCNRAKPGTLRDNTFVQISTSLVRITAPPLVEKSSRRISRSVLNNLWSACSPCCEHIWSELAPKPHERPKDYRPFSSIY